MSFGRIPLGLASSSRATRISRAVRSRFPESRSSSSSSSSIGPQDRRAAAARPPLGQTTGPTGTDGPSSPDPTEPHHPDTDPNGMRRAGIGPEASGRMERKGESRDGSIGASLKATYRALLARGLEAGEAANLTAFLHGLPSAGFHWTLAEPQDVLQRRIQHPADQRAAATPRRSGPRAVTRSRSTVHDRRANGRGSTHVIDHPPS